VKRLCIIILSVFAAFAPAQVFACAACGSGSTELADTPMIDGMNLGILTLGGVLFAVLGAAMTFLIYIIRKSEAVEAARQQAAQTPAN